MRHPHAVVVRNTEITRGRIIWDTGKQKRRDVTTDLGPIVPGSLPVWSASRKLDDCERVGKDRVICTHLRASAHVVEVNRSDPGASFVRNVTSISKDNHWPSSSCSRWK
jgi:hypothetical protein